MKQEDKELLLKDLCARLPYGVIVEYGCKYDGKDIGEKKSKLTGRMIDSFFDGITIRSTEVYSLQPYLRPMSSMTKEERHELHEILGKDVEIYDSIDIIDSSRKGFSFPELQAVFNWLNAHHFDYMGLIPMGLAIEVTEENNPYKE